MTKLRPLALVTHLPPSQCPLNGLHRLNEFLGPVKGKTRRQATRVANALRAGYAVGGYSEFECVRQVLVCAPAPAIDRIVLEMLVTPVDWNRKSVIWCHEDADSAALLALSHRGAVVGSLVPMDDVEKIRFFAEGDTRALREAKSFVESCGGELVEVGLEAQRFCAAASDLLGWLLAPHLEASMTCLRCAGLTPSRAKPLVEKMVERSVRRYLKGGLRVFRSPEEGCHRTAFLRRLSSLYQVEPETAELMWSASRLFLRHMKEDGTWLGNQSRSRPRAAAAGAGAESSAVAAFCAKDEKLISSKPPA